MKLINGRTLQAILNDQRHGEREAVAEFTLDRLLLIFRKVCDAIAFAHSKGVLHRDLKPENVMVGEFGEVLVMDWRIAKVMPRNTGVPPVPAGGHPDRRAVAVGTTAGQHSRDGCVPDFSAILAGTVTGTPQYMSPEQAQGRIDELDERSDIFSLGGILYTILTLRPPVQGATVPEILKMVAGAEITPSTVLNKGAPAGSTEPVPGAAGFVVRGDEGAAPGEVTAVSERPRIECRRGILAKRIRHQRGAGRHIQADQAPCAPPQSRSRCDRCAARV